MKDFNAGETPRLADDRNLIVRSKFLCTVKIWTLRVMRLCPENKWPFSSALQNAWEGLSYKANIGPGFNKQDSNQPAYPRGRISCVFASKTMNSENVDTGPSLQMHKLCSILFFF